MGVSDQCHGPDHFIPWKETWYQLYRRLGGPQPICTFTENLKLPPWDSVPRPSNLQKIAIPTTLSRCPIQSNDYQYHFCSNEHVISAFYCYYYANHIDCNFLSLIFFQLWRLITTFLFFGTVGFNFFFNMIFTYRYCRMLEEGSFRGRTADFVMMFLFGGICMIVSLNFAQD